MGIISKKPGEFKALSEKMSVCSLKTATDAHDFIICGRVFNVCGLAMAKACLPNSDRGLGIIRLPADGECNRCLAATTVTDMHMSTRYDGARLCRASLYIVRYSLNSMRCGTQSQLSNMW